MKDFIDVAGTRAHRTYTLKPDLTLDQDKAGAAVMHLSASAKNVEAMGKHYFDKSALDARLGTKGDQDYKNYYGTGALGTIDAYEKAVNLAHKKADPKYQIAEVRINLKELGLDKNLLNSSLPYTDTSPGKAHPVTESADLPAGHSIQPAKGPFGDPTLDQAFRAMQSGDQAQLSVAAQRMLDSPEGQKLMQTSNALLAQQPSQEQPAPAQQTPANTR